MTDNIRGTSGAAGRFGTAPQLDIERGHGEEGLVWLGRARRNWLTTLALIFLLAVGAIAAVPSFFGVPDPLVTAPRDAFLGPSRSYLFGSDDLGRDLFSRTVYGARVSLGTAFVVVVAAASIGVPIGLIAGYREGLVMSLSCVSSTWSWLPAISLATGIIGDPRGLDKWSTCRHNRQRSRFRASDPGERAPKKTESTL